MVANKLLPDLVDESSKITLYALRDGAINSIYSGKE